MECGIDVIVASATHRAPIGHGYAAQVRHQFTADEAALVLVDIAKECFPESDLAKHTEWDQAAISPADGIVNQILLDIKNSTRLRGKRSVAPIRVQNENLPGGGQRYRNDFE